MGWTLPLAVVLCTGVAQAAPAPSTCRATYERVRVEGQALRRDRKRRVLRHHWIRAIARTAEAARLMADCAEGPALVFLEAGLWRDLQRFSGDGSDLNQALTAYEHLAKRYADDALADDALWERAVLLRDQRHDKVAAAREIAGLLGRYPKGDMAARAKVAARGLPKVLAGTPRQPDEPTAARLFGRRDRRHGPPRLNEVRTWSNPDYSRVAMYLSGPAEARLGELPKGGPEAPARIFVDIADATLGPTQKPEVAVDDALLRRIRVAARPEGGGVRVVLDLKTPVRPRVIIMENPYRVVVDTLVGEGASPPPATLVGRRRRVVIDAGHGGHDSGALGPRGVREKDVVLAIARQVQTLLDASGVEAVLTRADDRFLSLEERTALANRLGADAFVSIHANSAPRRAARGIETYYLNVTDDRYAIRLAAVENKTSEAQVSDLQLILADLSTKANSQESLGLAQRMQRELVRQAKPLNPETRDLGVKASLFYVLLGARMPAVLVETSFVSNADEARLLARGDYQRQLARGIAQAISTHLGTPMVLGRP